MMEIQFVLDLLNLFTKNYETNFLFVDYYLSFNGFLFESIPISKNQRLAIPVNK